MSDYEFIKRFSNIKIKNICEKINVTPGNVSSGKMSSENFSKLKKGILDELLEILLEDEKENTLILRIFSEKIKKLEKENKNLREML